MKLKTTLMTLLFMAITFSTYSQVTTKDETEAIVNLIGVQKKQAISQLVHISPKDSVNFWKVYNLYEEDAKKIRTKRINYYETLANSYDKMDDKTADDFAKKAFDARIGQEKLLEQYYGKMKNATNAVLALQFYQSETYLLTLARAKIMEQIPTYGQLLNAQKKE